MTASDVLATYLQILYMQFQSGVIFIYVLLDLCHTEISKLFFFTEQLRPVVSTLYSITLNTSEKKQTNSKPNIRNVTYIASNLYNTKYKRHLVTADLLPS